MKISVIISTFNSPDWLQKVLWGYENQSVGGFEIVIADDGSEKETAELIRSFSNNQKFSIKHVRHDNHGFRKWEIVNKAIVASTGDYLIFTDGDCIPHPNLIEYHIALSKKDHFLSGGYCKLPMTTSAKISKADIDSGSVFSVFWLYRNGYKFSFKWMKILARKWRINRFLDVVSPAAKTFNGNNSSCFRKDAIAISGFDQRILYGGGDREFGYRLEHLGIKPRVIRYSILCLHLDHPRGYKSKEVRQKNLALIAKTRADKLVTTDFGISTK